MCTVQLQRALNLSDRGASRAGARWAALRNSEEGGQPWMDREPSKTRCDLDTGATAASAPQRRPPRRETEAERRKRAEKKKRKAQGKSRAALPGCAAARPLETGGRGAQHPRIFGIQRIEQVKDGLPLPGTGLHLCMCGQLQALRDRADAGRWHPATTDRYGSTALMWAAGSGHVAVAQWLVESHGADINAQNKDGRSALMWAVRNAQVRMSDWLVDRHSADVAAVNKSGTNLLHWAIWSGAIDAIEWVLARGAFSIDYRNYLGCSAAHWSATQGSAALCKYFAQRGVRFDAANKAGHTGVHKAAWYGKRKVMRYLIDPRELGGLGLWRVLAWRDDAGRTCWQLAATGPSDHGRDFGHELYSAWERGLRRELCREDGTCELTTESYPVY
jgi:ankyrin repeat protein